MGEMVRLDLQNDDASEERLLDDVAGPTGYNNGGGPTGDLSWRLNFDAYQLSPEHKEKPPRKLHDCLGVKGHFLSPLSFFIVIYYNCIY